MSCNGYPTADSMKLLETNAETINEVVTSTADLTTPASDGLQKTTLAGLEKEALSRSRTSSPRAIVDGQQDYSFAGFNASLSTYVIFNANGTFPNQTLIPDVDYTFADTTTETITLTSTWSGGAIIAKSLDPTGTGVIQSGVSFTESELVLSVGLSAGDVVFVPEIGNSKYIIMDSSYTPLIGDINLNSGLKAQLQPLNDGSWDVLAFGAFDDVDDGPIIQTEYFELAALRASGGYVSVPEGRYRITNPTTTPAIWRIAPGVLFTGVGTIPPTGLRDLSNLSGKVELRLTVDSFGQNYFGDPSLTVQQDTGRAQTTSVLSGASMNGNSGIAGYTHTSPKDDEASGSIAVKGVALQNNDVDTIKTGTWAGYLEAVRAPECTGNAIGLEVAIVNKGTAIDWTPPMGVAEINGDFTTAYWASSGIGEVDDTESTALFGAFANDGAEFKRGFVIRYGTISTGEMLCISRNEELCWYDLPTEQGGNEAKLNYIAGATGSTNRGRLSIGCRNDELESFQQYHFSTQAYFADGDGVVTSGRSSNRWSTVYAVDGVINTSDVRLKTFEDIEESERAVAIKLKGLMRKYKWNAALEREADGGKTARNHFGVGAQEVKEAFEGEGLNPDDYGVFCYDSWDAKGAEYSKTGDLISPAREAGDLYSIRYNELFAMILAAL